MPKDLDKKKFFMNYLCYFEVGFLSKERNDQKAIFDFDGIFYRSNQPIRNLYRI